MGLREWFTDVDSDCECDCCRPRRARPGSAAFASGKPEAAEALAQMVEALAQKGKQT